MSENKHLCRHSQPFDVVDLVINDQYRGKVYQWSGRRVCHFCDKDFGPTGADIRYMKPASDDIRDPKFGLVS